MKLNQTYWVEKTVKLIVYDRNRSFGRYSSAEASAKAAEPPNQQKTSLFAPF